MPKGTEHCVICGVLNTRPNSNTCTIVCYRIRNNQTTRQWQINNEKRHKLTQQKHNAQKYKDEKNWKDSIRGIECDVCGSTDINKALGEVLCLDHDHSCSSGRRSCNRCVRGTLCTKCNTVLGLVGEDIEILRGLIGYLNEWSMYTTDADPFETILSEG